MAPGRLATRGGRYLRLPGWLRGGQSRHARVGPGRGRWGLRSRWDGHDRSGWDRCARTPPTPGLPKWPKRSGRPQPACVAEVHWHCAADDDPARHAASFRVGWPPPPPCIRRARNRWKSRAWRAARARPGSRARTRAWEHGVAVGPAPFAARRRLLVASLGVGEPLPAQSLGEEAVALEVGEDDDLDSLVSAENLLPPAAAAAAADVPEARTVRVKFVLRKQCAFGQQFLVVGDDAALGLWDPAKATWFGQKATSGRRTRICRRTGRSSSSSCCEMPRGMSVGSMALTELCKLLKPQTPWLSTKTGITATNRKYQRRKSSPSGKKM
ncbi:uncharacterized protein [Miscanthus floridulus]|uniref:uncharacterized protein n=1 Tax=Miscanthus floridulus TaxID=154761 RepID=UPI00345ADF76